MTINALNVTSTSTPNVGFTTSGALANTAFQNAFGAGLFTASSDKAEIRGTRGSNVNSPVTLAETQRRAAAVVDFANSAEGKAALAALNGDLED
jgi:hypothetical protein